MTHSVTRSTMMTRDKCAGDSSSSFDRAVATQLAERLLAALLVLLLPPPADDLPESLVGGVSATFSEEFHRGVSQGSRDANREARNLCTFTIFLTRLDGGVSRVQEHTEY
jgi:hypothetical protein